MPRLFYGNFDFEESLATPDQQRSQMVNRILAELAPTWLAVASDDDLLWCPQAITSEFFGGLCNQGFPSIHAVSSIADIPACCEFVPWGWTTEAIAWARCVAAQVVRPSLDAVRDVNSRRFAWEQEYAHNQLLPGSRLVTGWDDLANAVERLCSLSMCGVIKSEFSQSGRDRYRFHGSKNGRHDDMEAWARPRLEAGGPLLVEPWLNALAEVGIQLTIGTDGQVDLEGLTGTAYRNGAFAVGNFSLTPDEVAEWEYAVEIAMEVGQAVAERGYFGPLGIDAMRYRDFEGTIRVRAIQDINARWTMGRLCLGHRRLLQENEHGRWLMGPSVADLNSTETVPLPHRRIIETAPHEIADRPVRLKTALMFESSSGR